MHKQRTHIIGAGWAGISAAVHACQLGHEVHVFESAPRMGGRAASHIKNHRIFDQGQHILIGAYYATLELINFLGGEEKALFTRMGLGILDANGQGFELPKDSFGFKALRALLGNKRWRAKDKFSALVACIHWMLNSTSRAILTHLDLEDTSLGADMSVQAFFKPIPQALMDELIEPLCLAALNTPIQEASARLFVRVLRDAFQNPPQSCEMLIPKVPLSELLATPARSWLEQHSAQIHLSSRITSLEVFDPKDNIVVCTPAREAAKLCSTTSKSWSENALALEHNRICTVYLRAQANAKSHQLCALTALDSSRLGSAQFAIKTPLSPDPHWVELAFVTSAAPMLDKHQFEAIITQQAQSQLGLTGIEVLQCVCDKQATFKAKFGLKRPTPHVGQNIWAAGDYVMGPYPATLEGAVRSGQHAIDLIQMRFEQSQS